MPNGLVRSGPFGAAGPGGLAERDSRPFHCLFTLHAHVWGRHRERYSSGVVDLELLTVCARGGSLRSVCGEDVVSTVPAGPQHGLRPTPA